AGKRPKNIIDVFNGAGAFRVNDVPYHVEAFYKYQVTDNISVTPGVIWLLNPNQTDSADSIIGTLRTTFTF
ncbi:MAG: carbohydrate porin, partial [Symploca sp. SIO1A3]|nr:carbohydrate porin [Symploca sp. SIO1A3]